VKSNIARSGASVVVMCLLSCAEVLANSASWTGQCYSISLGVGVTTYGWTYFTTYDGSSGPPLHDMKDGYFIVSGELKPVTPGSGTNRTDYGSSIDGSYAGIYEYGHASVALPTTDSDTNGFPDIIQLNKSGNTAITGTAQSDWTYSGSSYTYTVSGNLYRAIGNDTGTYSLTLTYSLGSMTASGSIHLPHWSGTITYTRGSSNLTMVGTLFQPDGYTRTLTGTTSYIINSTNLNNSLID